MDPKELKKIVCQNLRSVTQSCKGGVPLHRLQFDYKALLGCDIPYKSLGFESLESFIWNIPDVVRIKVYNGQHLVEGVVDPSTAHIANMISRQKKAKGIGLKKPASGTKNSDSFSPLHRGIQSYLQASKSTTNSPIDSSNAKIAATKTESESSLQNHQESSTDEYSLPLNLPNFYTSVQLLDLEHLTDNSMAGQEEQIDPDKNFEVSKETHQVDWEDIISKEGMSSDGASWKTLKRKKARRKKKKPSQSLSSPLDLQEGDGNKMHIPPRSQDSFKVQVQIDPKMEDLKKAVLINLRGVTMSRKDGVLLQNLQGDYRTLIGTPIPFDILGYDSLESFIQSIPDVIKLKMNFSGQLVAEAVPDASTAHIFNLISRQKQVKKSGKIALSKLIAQKNKSSKPKSVQVSQKSEMSSVESLSVTCQSSSSSKDVASRSITAQKTSKESNLTDQLSKKIPDKHDLTAKGSDSVRLSGKTLGSFPCIKDNITNAHFSTLLGLHNILFGVSYMDTLKESILKFGGYLFLEDSEEWKKREFLLSVLPTDGLNEYLNLLCVEHCDTEEKHALLSKLLSFIASLHTEMIDPKRKLKKKLADSDLYKKCQEKDKQIREAMQENENLKAQLLKIKNDSKKVLKENSMQNSTNSELQEAKDNIIVDQSVEIDYLKDEVKKLKSELIDAAAKTKEKEKDSLQCEVKKLKSELIDAAAKTKEKEKEKGKFECELNELRHDRKVDCKTHEKQKDYLKDEVKKLKSELIDAAAKTKEKEKDSLQCEVKKLKSELIDAAAKTKEKEKEKGKFECELNELRHDRKVDCKTHEKQKMEFLKYITNTSNKIEKQRISHAAEIKAIQEKLSSYESVFNLLKNQTAILKKEVVSRPVQHTTITLPLINQLLGILNEVHVQPQQSLSSA